MDMLDIFAMLVHLIAVGLGLFVGSVLYLKARKRGCLGKYRWPLWGYPVAVILLGIGNWFFVNPYLMPKQFSWLLTYILGPIDRFLVFTLPGIVAFMVSKKKTPERST